MVYSTVRTFRWSWDVLWTLLELIKGAQVTRKEQGSTCIIASRGQRASLKKRRSRLDYAITTSRPPKARPRTGLLILLPRLLFLGAKRGARRCGPATRAVASGHSLISEGPVQAFGEFRPSDFSTLRATPVEWKNPNK